MPHCTNLRGTAQSNVEEQDCFPFPGHQTCPAAPLPARLFAMAKNSRFKGPRVRSHSLPACSAGPVSPATVETGKAMGGPDAPPTLQALPLQATLFTSQLAATSSDP